ncbi:MAG: endolytic transglycosylase MltG [Candidatus Marinimicrobia bacterium]|nr:endolytic transglycosylase MltG [Candidatus Neomarinimicrobiota bacterium]
MQRSPARRTIILVVAALLALGAFRSLIFGYPINPIFRDAFTVPNGASATRIAVMLEEAGLIPDADLFITAVRLKGGTRSIRPGRYLLVNVRTVGDLTRQILQPDWRPIVVFVPEGATRDLVPQYFAAKYPTDVEHFLALTEDRDFMTRLGIGMAPHMEGYLLPETYHISNGLTEEGIIEQMVALTLKTLGEQVIAKGARLGLNPHEILTMASIVEGEAMLDEERGVISAVYHNRLREGMRLQADPTVQYALPDGPRRLFFRDYKYPSAYNTYLHKGLPPGPINNPGRASILAAVMPSDVDYLYFVANGEGGHIFTQTFDEHTKAIRRIRSGD